MVQPLCRILSRELDNGMHMVVGVMVTKMIMHIVCILLILAVFRAKVVANHVPGRFSETLVKYPPLMPSLWAPPCA